MNNKIKTNFKMSNIHIISIKYCLTSAKMQYFAWKALQISVEARVRSNETTLPSGRGQRKRKWRFKNKTSSGRGQSTTGNIRTVRFMLVLLQLGPRKSTNRDDGLRSFLVWEFGSCCSGSDGELASIWLRVHYKFNWFMVKCSVKLMGICL